MIKKNGKSEEKQKSLVENILDGIFIIQNNRLIYINEAVVNITGYSIEELHSMTFRDIIADDGFKANDNNFRRKWLYTAITRAKESLIWIK